MNHTKLMSIAVAFCIITLPRMASAAQTLTIGTASAQPGETVSIPLTLSATVNCTAALLRIQYDATKLENATVEAGALLGPNHVMETHTPVAGRLNIAIFPRAGAPAFTAQAGELAVLTFKIKTDAPAGEALIKIASKGMPELPAANLIKTNSLAASLSVQTGKVVVVPVASVKKSWTDYR